MKILFGLVIGTLLAGYGIFKLGSGGMALDPFVYFGAGLTVVLLAVNDKSNAQLLKAYREMVFATQTTVGAMAIANMILDGKITKDDIRFDVRATPRPMPVGSGIVGVDYHASMHALTEAGYEAVNKVTHEFMLRPAAECLPAYQFKGNIG